MEAEYQASLPPPDSWVAQEIYRTVNLSEEEEEELDRLIELQEVIAAERLALTKNPSANEDNDNDAPNGE